MWIIEVANRTPPPKHSNTEVTVRFQPLSSLWKYAPILIGRYPRMREIPPSSTMQIILAVLTSMIFIFVFVDLWPLLDTCRIDYCRWAVSGSKAQTQMKEWTLVNGNLNIWISVSLWWNDATIWYCTATGQTSSRILCIVKWTEPEKRFMVRYVSFFGYDFFLGEPR